ncbi:MAG: hypothetical protein U9N33_04425 [Campylobacterota bacterium]|nr:hypothetical protein [Campylobacterota bacterium]
MNKKIEKILEIWHKHFELEDRQYSEYESSDIEYFVGCLLYNHFAFEKALDTMKTMDLSYDFLEACGDEYDEVMSIIKEITFDTDAKRLLFLQNYIKESQNKYTDDELYLLNRLEYHIDSLAYRYENDIQDEKVSFKVPEAPSRNPLLR